MGRRSYVDVFLQRKMESQEGDYLRSALAMAINEEEKALELFKIQIKHCRENIKTIDDRVAANNPTHDLMAKRRAFEEQELILNVAAQVQQCSYEIKGIQKILYFENSGAGRERMAVEVSLMIYEWCNDLQEMTGKKFQDLSKRLLSQPDLVKLRIARKKLKEFFDKENQELSNIRHNVGAHRDHDFLNQREILEDTDWSKAIELLHNFEVLIIDFGHALQVLIDAGLKQISVVFK